MEGTFREQLFFLVLCLSFLKGDTRYIEENDITPEGLFALLNSELKREIPETLIYSRPLRCLDMVAVEGQFTFTADRPQLSCASFFIAEPDQVISVEYDSVDIDCRGGDFIKLQDDMGSYPGLFTVKNTHLNAHMTPFYAPKMIIVFSELPCGKPNTVFDGWVMKGEKFPSSQDHALPLMERYVDYCDSGTVRRTVRSSQNVAMLFFRIHTAGSSFTLTVRKPINPFPCNIISQTPEGSFTMVIPQQHRNCSFSIIYPVEIKIAELSLGHLNDFPIKRSIPGCAGAGDFVELLGGNGMDPSKMFPVADLCYKFNGPAQMKIGCDNTVVRMVSSGRFVNRVAFQYRLLDRQELQRIKVNSVEDFCFTG